MMYARPAAPDGRAFPQVVHWGRKRYTIIHDAGSLRLSGFDL